MRAVNPIRHGSPAPDRVRAAARQEQFLEVASAEEARARFEQHLDLSPLAAETVRLSDALGRVLAHDVVAAVDAPPFDRSNVDGFALRAADTVGASDANPKLFQLNAEVIACGHAPELAVAPGTATTIASLKYGKAVIGLCAFRLSAERQGGHMRSQHGFYA
jgi:putative molybdopterin biosynthesis protein